MMKILAVNPGSTTTKIAVFEDTTKIFSEDVIHDADTLNTFETIMDQLEYRRDTIIAQLASEGYNITDFDAFSGRGGGVAPCEGGTYNVTDQVTADARKNSFHPATLGSMIVDQFSKIAGKPAFIVNPPDVDEFQPVARVTGLKDVYRESRFHALSHKEVGREAAEKLGKRYDEVNLVVAHIGGGISVGAHKKGKIVDASDLLNGDCPMAPTRAGVLAPGKIMELCFDRGYTKKDIKELILKNGGFVDHFGTSDARDVIKMAEEGNVKAQLVYNAMVYQVGKQIGSFAAVLHGKVDAIVLTGGISRSKELVAELKEMVGYIADFIVFPGELEMEALAAGAYRVLSGEEKAKEYTGKPVWTGYDDYTGENNGV